MRRQTRRVTQPKSIRYRCYKVTLQCRVLSTLAYLKETARIEFNVSGVILTCVDEETQRYREWKLMGKRGPSNTDVTMQIKQTVYHAYNCRVLKRHEPSTQNITRTSFLGLLRPFKIFTHECPSCTRPMLTKTKINEKKRTARSEYLSFLLCSASERRHY